MIIFSGESSFDVGFTNETLFLSMAVMSDWNQNTLITFNELLNKTSVTDMLPLLNISKRGIYKSIKSNKLREYVDYFEHLARILIK